VCVRVCIHRHTHTYTHTHTLTRKHRIMGVACCLNPQLSTRTLPKPSTLKTMILPRMHIHTHTNTFTHTPTNHHTYSDTHTHTNTHDTHTCTRTHAHTHTCTHAHTHIYTYASDQHCKLILLFKLLSFLNVQQFYFIFDIETS